MHSAARGQWLCLHFKRALSSVLSQCTCQLGSVKLLRINVPCYVTCHLHASSYLNKSFSLHLVKEHGFISAVHPHQWFYCYRAQ